MNHLFDHTYSWSCLIHFTGKDPKGRSQAVGWCSMAVLSSLELNLQFHPPQGPCHGGSAWRVAWSWRQVLLHIPQAAQFPDTSIASSTFCYCPTMIFCGGHLESLNFSFLIFSENECWNVRNTFGLKIIDLGSLWQRSWTMNMDGPCASFYTDARAHKLYDWSMLLQMILHLVIVPEVHTHCLRVLWRKERTIIEGLILPNF